jgi:phosphatidylglycerophosphate synthase
MCKALETRRSLKLQDTSSQTQFDHNTPDPGRPREIEERLNLYLIHPLSWRLVRVLLSTPITPNAVSVSGAVMAFAAASCFYYLPWPMGALAGFACMFLTHVLDGLDGRLARVSGRGSANGEIIDGLCDHIGYTAVYCSMALVLVRDIGQGPAWTFAILAGISNILHASSYEYQRRTYNHHVYGRLWIRNKLGSKSDASKAEIEGSIFTLIGRFSLFIQGFVSAENPKVDEAMSHLTSQDTETTEKARDIYRSFAIKQVRNWSVLGQNHKTLAIFLGMLAGNPVYFFIYVATVLNVVLGILIFRQHQINSTILARLSDFKPVERSA